ncbi:hypothetical protein GCM10027614_28580 [Micromonospora vulcania]
MLSRDRAPELFALIDEVAVAIGAPAPDVVGVDGDGDINAYAGAVGLRRRKVLGLGLPLWGSLTAGERVALLGHELGHFVNGDPRRGLLTQPAFTMLGSAADLFRPVSTVVGGGLVEMIGDALGRAFQWVASRLLFVAHLLLVSVALRDGQRAEYLADELSARVAGTKAATDLLDALLDSDSMELVVRRESRAGHGPDRWRSALSQSRSASADRLPLLRQLSVRDATSLFASHPPAGLRDRMLTGRGWLDPTVVLTPARMERIDDELTRSTRAFVVPSNGLADAGRGVRGSAAARGSRPMIAGWRYRTTSCGCASMSATICSGCPASARWSATTPVSCCSVSAPTTGAGR